MAPIIWQKLAGDFSIGSHCLSLKAKWNGGGIEKQKKKKKKKEKEKEEKEEQKKEEKEED